MVKTVSEVNRRMRFFNKKNRSELPFVGMTTSIYPPYRRLLNDGDIILYFGLIVRWCDEQYLVAVPATAKRRRY